MSGIRSEARVLGPVVQLEGGYILDVRALLEMGIQVARRDGIIPSDRIAHLRKVFDEGRRNVMSERGHADVRDDPTAATWDMGPEEQLGVQEVADMAGISDRQVRRLAEKFGGHKTRSGPWTFNRSLVEAQLARQDTA